MSTQQGALVYGPTSVAPPPVSSVFNLHPGTDGVTQGFFAGYIGSLSPQVYRGYQIRVLAWNNQSGEGQFQMVGNIPANFWSRMVLTGWFDVYAVNAQYNYDGNNNFSNWIFPSGLIIPDSGSYTLTIYD